MKIQVLFAILVAVSSQASAKSLNCFSKHYGERGFLIEIAAEIAGNDVVENLTVTDKGDGFTANVASLVAVDGHHRSGSFYAGYQNFNVENDIDTGYGLHQITALLPKNLMSVDSTVTFCGYASDPNPDSDGSVGYYQLVCSIK